MDTEVTTSLYDSHTWRQNVAMYRRMEQRRDRAVNPTMRTNWGNELGRQYMLLSNAARQIVIEANKDKRSQTQDRVEMLDSRVVYTGSPRFAFKLKWYAHKPGNLWFQRFEHEPWFELGYFDAMRLKWFDTLEARERPALLSPEEGNTVHAILEDNVNPFEALKDARLDAKAAALDYRIAKREAMVNAYGGRTDHVHSALTDIDPNNLAKAFNSPAITARKATNVHEKPEDLEAAAAHAMARAAELRALDALEPEGDEPTITWTWTPEYEGAETYTYVAFKATNGRWYQTGDGQGERRGMVWRDLVSLPHNAALKEGNFLIATAWGKIGDE